MAARKRNGRAGWEFVFDLPAGPNGERKQRRRAGFKTKKEAEAAERDERALIDKGIVISGGDLTVGDYLAQWLAHKRSSVEYATYTGYEGFVRLHLTPALGRIQLRKLRPLEVQAAYRRITDKGLASTAQHSHIVLKLALRQAVQWQLIPTNPVEAVEAPKAMREAGLQLPSVEQLTQLLDAADETSHGPLFRLVAMTGLRRGEALGLHWYNVNLDGETPSVTVSEAAQRQGAAGIVMKAPKRAHSARTVLLMPESVDALREHRRRQAEEKMRERLDYQDTGLVFATALGLPLDGTNVWRTWDGIAKRAGVACTIHQLRHTHATHLLQAGVHPKIVQERLGHASIDITMNLYSHVTPTMQAEALEKMRRMIDG